MVDTYKFTALLVDENSQARENLASTLRRNGFQTLQAKSGSHALSMIETEEFNVIVMENNMHEMSGVEVLGMIRISHPEDKLPVMILLEEGDKETAQEAMVNGVNACYYRPVSDIKGFVEQVKGLCS